MTIQTFYHATLKKVVAKEIKQFAGHFDLIPEWLALRTIISLHRPQEITLPNGEWGANCRICDGNEYPCTTIAVIWNEFN